MEELIRLQMQVEGEAKVREAQATVRAYQKALDDTTVALKGMGASQAQLAAGTNHIVVELAKATQQLGQMQQALAGAGGGGSGKMTNVLMQMPGLLEDMQYRLKGVGNNIVAMTTSLGPWGAAIGIGVVGAIQLVEHWDELSTLWGAGHTKTEAERMEALAKATHRTVEETKAYTEWKRREEIGKAGDGPTKAAKERGDAVGKVFAENGGLTAAASELARWKIGGSFNVENVMAQANTDERAQLAKANQIENMPGMWGLKGDIANAHRKAVYDQIMERLLDENKAILTHTGTDPDSIETLAKQLEKSGQKDLADKLRGVARPGFKDEEAGRKWLKDSPRPEDDDRAKGFKALITKVGGDDVEKAIIGNAKGAEAHGPRRATLPRSTRSSGGC